MSYVNAGNVIGTPDITAVVLAGAIGDPTGIAELPSAQMATKLGSIIEAQDQANAWQAQFIYLSVPVSTTITPGLLYQFDKNYNVVVVPVGGTSKNTGVQVVCAYTAVTSNASAVQFAWFLYQGVAPVLKTAVTVNPQVPVYISATAGRIKVLSSAGQQILGARTQNTATVTSTTSTVNVYLGPSSLEGV